MTTGFEYSGASVLALAKNGDGQKNKTSDQKVINGVDTATGQGSQAISKLQEVAQNNGGFIKNMDLNNPSWDLFIALFFMIGALLYGFSLGRDRIVVIMVSIFMALAVVDALPNFVVNVAFNGQSAFQVTTFISLFIVLFFIISRSALLRTIGAGLSNGRWYQTIIFSMLHVGLLISITLSFLPTEILTKFTPQTQQIFTGEWPHFAWIIAPIFAMIIFGGKTDEE